MYAIFRTMDTHGTACESVKPNARKECASYWGFNPDWPFVKTKKNLPVYGTALVVDGIEVNKYALQVNKFRQLHQG